MSARIDAKFSDARAAGRKTLIPFITAGDPSPAWTVDIMHALVDGGADLLELGVPFSDPMADGPVIQAASERAIERGVTLGGVLDLVTAFRGRDEETPVILMGYMNPVERYGAGAFAAAASQAGVDGLLLVDCPPGEDAELDGSLEGQGIDSIRLVAPTTTPERVGRICAAARGFVYYVSFKGITGADRLVAGELAGPIGEIRRHADLPVVAGFGISDAASAVAVAEHADGVVVGSALVRLLAESESRESACEHAGRFVASIRQALDNSRQ